MSVMTKATLVRVKKHMEQRAKHNEEGCGIIVKNGRWTKFIPCVNQVGKDGTQRFMGEDADPATSFMIDPKIFLYHKDTIIGIVHSHLEVDGKPSPTDVMRQRATNLPWVVIEMTDGKYDSHFEFGEVIA